MMFLARKLDYLALAILFLLLFPGCKKSVDVSDPDGLPDLSKQTRPFVTVENTKVRAGPGPQFRNLADIPAKAKIHVVGRDGDWALIVSKKGNAPGFVELAAIKPGEGEQEEDKDAGEARPSEGRYVTVADTQVRSGAGLHYPAIADIPKGTKLTVVDEDNGWLKVESKRGNKPGFVERSLAKPLNEN